MSEVGEQDRFKQAFLQGSDKVVELRATVQQLTRENRVLKSIIASHPGIRQAIEEAHAAIEAGDTITLEELRAELECHPDNVDRSVDDMVRWANAEHLARLKAENVVDAARLMNQAFQHGCFGCRAPAPEDAFNAWKAINVALQAFDAPSQQGPAW